MPHDDGEDDRIYRVVVNDQEQYSIWPADREIPLGWVDAGKAGTKAECLAYINEVWSAQTPDTIKRMREEAERRRRELDRG